MIDEAVAERPASTKHVSVTVTTDEMHDGHQKREEIAVAHDQRRRRGPRGAGQYVLTPEIKTYLRAHYHREIRGSGRACAAALKVSESYISKWALELGLRDKKSDPVVATPPAQPPAPPAPVALATLPEPEPEPTPAHMAVQLAAPPSQPLSQPIAQQTPEQAALLVLVGGDPNGALPQLPAPLAALLTNLMRPYVQGILDDLSRGQVDETRLLARQAMMDEARALFTREIMERLNRERAEFSHEREELRGQLERIKRENAELVVENAHLKQAVRQRNDLIRGMQHYRWYEANLADLPPNEQGVWRLYVRDGDKQRPALTLKKGERVLVGEVRPVDEQDEEVMRAAKARVVNGSAVVQ